MHRLRALLLVLVTVPLLSSCVAFVLPLAAIGTMGKTHIDRVKTKREFVAEGAVDLNLQPGGEAVATVLPVTHQQSEFAGQGGGLDGDAVGSGVPGDKDYLSRFLKPVDPLQQTPYAGFTGYALAQAAKLVEGEGVSSTVLVPRVDIIKPKTIDCAGKPLAVLIDLDDGQHKNWTEAETLYRQDGLIEALNQLRVAEISVIWLSDEPVTVSGRIASILKEAGLSAQNADDFIFLDRGGEDRKQERRWDAARNYCIVAMAGDKRADFDELYDYLRDPDGAITLEHMFGNGWFLTPPPLVVDAGENGEEPEENEG